MTIKQFLDREQALEDNLDICFVTPIYSLISKFPSGIEDPDFISSVSRSVSGSIVGCLFVWFAFFGGILPYLLSLCSTCE